MKKYIMVWVAVALIFSVALLFICNYMGLSDSKIIAIVALLGLTLSIMNLFLGNKSEGEIK